MLSFCASYFMGVKLRCSAHARQPFWYSCWSAYNLFPATICKGRDVIDAYWVGDGVGSLLTWWEVVLT